MDVLVVATASLLIVVAQRAAAGSQCDQTAAMRPLSRVPVEAMATASKARCPPC
jgi:hypothetical protein